MFYYSSTSSNTCLSFTPRLTKRVGPNLFCHSGGGANKSAIA
ncbi:hypothetical protein RintRC_6434 [Richelia intracellularis]|nr:hypothetical protein RintRC_6434 [Richelia intracellularis]